MFVSLRVQRREKGTQTVFPVPDGLLPALEQVTFLILYGKQLVRLVGEVLGEGDQFPWHVDNQILATLNDHVTVLCHYLRQVPQVEAGRAGGKPSEVIRCHNSGFGEH